MVAMFDNTEEIEQFLKDRAEALAMSVNPCGLDELTEDWACSAQRTHSAKGYFDIKGINVTRAVGREITDWKQPMIMDNGGVIVLIQKMDSPVYGEPLILVRANAEPGNKGYPLANGANSRVLLSPPIQFSMAKLRNHPEKVPLSWLITDEIGELLITTEPAPEDGGRFYEKVNRYGLLTKERVESRIFDTEVDKLGAASIDFVWITRRALRDACRKGWVSGHLRSAMSLLV